MPRYNDVEMVGRLPGVSARAAAEGKWIGVLDLREGSGSDRHASRGYMGLQMGYCREYERSAFSAVGGCREMARDVNTPNAALEEVKSK
jgi:hypothetical protein